MFRIPNNTADERKLSRINARHDMQNAIFHLRAAAAELRASGMESEADIASIIADRIHSVRSNIDIEGVVKFES